MVVRSIVIKMILINDNSGNNNNNNNNDNNNDNNTPEIPRVPFFGPAYVHYSWFICVI